MSAPPPRDGTLQTAHSQLTFQMTFKVCWVNMLFLLSILKYLNSLGSQRHSFFPAGKQCFEAQMKATKERDGLSGIET